MLKTHSPSASCNPQSLLEETAAALAAEPQQICQIPTGIQCKGLTNQFLHNFSMIFWAVERPR